MSIFISPADRVIVQGITGTSGAFNAAQMRADGTQIVAGVTPGKGGQTVAGVPVFNTIAEAQQALSKSGQKPATWTVGFVPAAFAKAAALEAIEAKLNTVVITEHVPVHDTLAILAAAKQQRVRAVGPNCPGLIVPGKKATKLGIMPANVFAPGPVGVVSRSGTLTYEVVSRLSTHGIGQSTCIGIGGDPINLTSMQEVLLAFAKDPHTKLIILIGEIGGRMEEYVAETVIPKIKKPVVAFLAGRAAPLGTTLGHAGAIIEGKTGTIASKERALKKAGVQVASTLGDIVGLVHAILTRT
ncbi:MAG: succinate--CoA ligase subunit alpha [Candidatus Andersenbacteria bacterium]